MPFSCSQRATWLPSRSIASATNAPPGAMMTPVPVAFVRSGRYAVKVGVTTLKTTVPSGVFSTVVSFWVHCSDPGAAPGQILTVCAWAKHTMKAVPAAASHNGRRMFLPLFADPALPRGRSHSKPVAYCCQHLVRHEKKHRGPQYPRHGYRHDEPEHRPHSE